MHAPEISFRVQGGNKGMCVPDTPADIYPNVCPLESDSANQEGAPKHAAVKHQTLERRLSAGTGK